jgi:hypothetical protein
MLDQLKPFSMGAIVGGWVMIRVEEEEYSI